MITNDDVKDFMDYMQKNSTKDDLEPFSSALPERRKSCLERLKSLRKGKARITYCADTVMYPDGRMERIEHSMNGDRVVTQLTLETSNG